MGRLGRSVRGQVVERGPCWQEGSHFGRYGGGYRFRHTVYWLSSLYPAAAAPGAVLAPVTASVARMLPRFGMPSSNWVSMARAALPGTCDRQTDSTAAPAAGVTPVPAPLDVIATLDDGTVANVRHLAVNPQIAEHHITRLALRDLAGAATPLPRLVAEAIRDADAIILGPGGLFESLLPNMLIDSFRDAVSKSAARKLYICNLMTEPGRTTGFSVADHIREIKRYAGFAPDYVLVNVQRIDSDVHQLYAAAHQSPVYLSPDEYEETAVLPGDRDGQRRLVIEGSVVIEADLASSVIQYTATLDNPDQSRAVHVLRHDADKLTATVLELLRRT